VRKMLLALAIAAAPMVAVATPAAANPIALHLWLMLKAHWTVESLDAADVKSRTG